MCGKGKYKRQLKHTIIAEEGHEKCFKLTIWGRLIEKITDRHIYHQVSAIVGLLWFGAKHSKMNSF